MAIRIIDWQEKLFDAKNDCNVGIKIATLLESNEVGTYITIIQPGESVNPHYHQHGNEEYHILQSSGVIRLRPLSEKKNDGCEPLTLLFSCPHTHLNKDRYMVDAIERT